MGGAAAAGQIAGQLGGKFIESIPGLVSSGQEATEMRQWGKQNRKHDRISFADERNRNQFYDHLGRAESVDTSRMDRNQRKFYDSLNMGDYKDNLEFSKDRRKFEDDLYRERSVYDLKDDREQGEYRKRRDRRYDSMDMEDYRGDLEFKKGRRDYEDNLSRYQDREGISKQELSSSKSGSSLYGRWANESRDYNKFKNQVEDELMKSGAIRIENNETIYDKDIDNKRAALFDKLAGYTMTRDMNNKIIGSQTWDDVNKNDEAILAGEAETKRRKESEFRSNNDKAKSKPKLKASELSGAYGVNGPASARNVFM